MGRVGGGGCGCGCLCGFGGVAGGWVGFRRLMGGFGRLLGVVAFAPHIPPAPHNPIPLPPAPHPPNTSMPLHTHTPARQADSLEIKTNAIAAYVAGGLSSRVPELMASLKVAPKASFEVAFNRACALVEGGDLAGAETALRMAIKQGALFWGGGALFEGRFWGGAFGGGGVAGGRVWGPLLRFLKRGVDGPLTFERLGGGWLSLAGCCFRKGQSCAACVWRCSRRCTRSPLAPSPRPALPLTLEHAHT